MVQFSQQPIIEEGIDELVSESEKKERIRKALEIHMLQNREAHAGPSGQTLFSFTQGDPNAVIGKIHQFGKTMGEEEQPKQVSIEEQRMQQQQQQWQTEHKATPAPVRTCPCCVRFLQDTFHMNANEATAFAGGGAEGGSVGYQSNAPTESYGATGPSSEYSGAPSGNYSSGGDGGGSEYMSSKKEESAGKYMGQSKGYEEE